MRRPRSGHFLTTDLRLLGSVVLLLRLLRLSGGGSGSGNCFGCHLADLLRRTVMSQRRGPKRIAKEQENTKARNLYALNANRRKIMALRGRLCLFRRIEILS